MRPVFIDPTFQRLPHFGPVYAANVGGFALLSVLSGRGFDGVRPGRFGMLGSLVCLPGVGVIQYGPRG